MINQPTESGKQILVTEDNDPTAYSMTDLTTTRLNFGETDMKPEAHVMANPDYQTHQATVNATLKTVHAK